MKLIDSTTQCSIAQSSGQQGDSKIHTCWDDALIILNMVNITPVKLHNSKGKGLEQSVFRNWTVIVEDRAYFDFLLMLEKINSRNVFVTRIKRGALYKTDEELDFPEDTDQNILKEEIISLTSDKTTKTGIAEHHLRLV